MDDNTDEYPVNTMSIVFHLSEDGDLSISSLYHISEDMDKEIAVDFLKLLEGTILKISTDPEDLMYLSDVAGFAMSMRQSEQEALREEEINRVLSDQDGTKVVSVEALRRMKTEGRKS